MLLDLYHGGEAPVFAPRPTSPQATRSLDFGSGFYVTTCLEQARKWVGIRIRQHVYDVGCVSHYHCDLDNLKASGLLVKEFKGPTEEWFDFVMANRHVPAFTHSFDVVIGPVANDNVYETLTLFEDGIITRQEAIVRLRTYKLVDQMLFHSASALAFLKYIDSEEQ